MHSRYFLTGLNIFSCLPLKTNIFDVFFGRPTASKIIKTEVQVSIKKTMLNQEKTQDSEEERSEKL